MSTTLPAGEMRGAPGMAELWAELRALRGAIHASPARRHLALLAAITVMVICATAAAQIRLNAWNEPFYDALSRRNLAGFGEQLLVFFAIVSVLLVLGVAQTWLRETLKIRLREVLTRDLLGQWLAPGRAFRMLFAGEVGANPDQRIQEDTRRFSELSADLGVGLVQATLLLVSFVGVLWLLSAKIVFVVGDSRFGIPGYMVWCALAYALTGSLVSWRVGWPLITLNAERYGLEAELRFALVRVSDHADGVALHRGEADERQRLEFGLDRLLGVMTRLARALTRLNWITAGYGWLALVVPIIVAAPGYFGGDLSFGELMMVVGAFNQVQQALRWFVDNFAPIAEWRAALGRITAFRNALARAEGLGAEVGRITVEEVPEDGVELDHLTVTLTEGEAGLDESSAAFHAGDRVLITGKPGSGKSTLFRALAGLWPWGGGRIRLPPRSDVMFVPQRPYLPIGSLRSALAYPKEATTFDESAIRQALNETCLGHLIPLLDTARRWDRELSLEEQELLSFARILLHRPRWVVLDEAFDALDEDHRHAVQALFATKLAGMGVIGIARRGEKNGFYKEVLHLRRKPNGVRHPRPLPGAPAAGRTKDMALESADPAASLPGVSAGPRPPLAAPPPP